MAKVTFNKLNLKKKEDIKNIMINEVDVEVKQYLPIENKISIIENVLRNAVDDNNFINPVKVDVYFSLEVIYAYTNINFTDKQKEDPQKLYDLFEETGTFNKIVEAIPEDEYNLLFDWTKEVIEGFEKHRDSVMGILEQVSTDYKDLDFDADQIKNKISEPGNLELLKQVLEKLG